MNAARSIFLRKTSFKGIIIILLLALFTGLLGPSLPAAQAKEITHSEVPLLPYASLSGTVRDVDTDLPIGGAKVEVNTGEIAYTDASGTYSIGLDAGTYTVTASAAYYFSQTVTNIILDIGMTNQDFDLKHQPVTLAGIVSDSYNRRPLAGAKVQVNTGEFTYTSADGEYSFGLPQGVYTVTASLTDYATAIIPNVTLVAEPVELDIELVHDPLPVVLTGFVTDAYFLTGIQGAIVELQTGQTYSTQISGSYSFVVEPGVYTISVSAVGYVPQVKGPFTITLGTLTTNFSLVPTVCPTVAIEAVNADVEDLEATFTSDVAPLLGITYAWDFGDGSTSTDANPVHEYEAYSTYVVTLDVVNICGATDSWVGSVTLKESFTSFLPMTVKQ